MNNPKGYFLLDTNIYRILTYGLTETDILAKAKELREKESKFEHQRVCSVIVALELISHLTVSDPARQHCYKALFLLNHHTKALGNEPRLIAYSLENVLTNFFLDKNCKQFQNYNEVIRLMNLLTERYDISLCDTYIAWIDEIADGKKSFRQGVQNQAETILKERGLSWDSFTAPVLRVNKAIKQINQLRVAEYKQGDSFYKLATILINEVYSNTCKLWPPRPHKAKVQEYLDIFQAPLQLYHLLLRKIGEAPTMEDAESDKWNTINDMHLLFNLCDKVFRNTILVTNDKLVLECGVTFGLKGRIGRLVDYEHFLKQ